MSKTVKEDKKSAGEIGDQFSGGRSSRVAVHTGGTAADVFVRVASTRHPGRVGGQGRGIVVCPFRRQAVIRLSTPALPTIPAECRNVELNYYQDLLT